MSFLPYGEHRIASSAVTFSVAGSNAEDKEGVSTEDGQC